MKQKVVLFVSLVCFAQLGVTLTKELVKNFSNDSSIQQTFSSELENLITSIAQVKQRAQELLASPKVETLAHRVDDDKSSPPQENEQDPFVPFYSITAETSLDRLAPLTSYELSQLRVSAIIGDAQNNRIASVETVSGGIFIVRPGTPVGKHGGTIQAITEQDILIAEPTSNIHARANNHSITEITLSKGDS